MILFWCLITLMCLIAAGFVLIPTLSNGTQTKQKPWLPFFSFIFILALSLGLYRTWGDSQQLAVNFHKKQEREMVRTELAKFKNMNELIARFKTILARNPDSAQGWYLLGKLYLDKKEYKDSLVSLQKAYKLAPRNSKYMVTYAELYLLDKRMLPLNLQKSLLAIPPKDSNILIAYNLLASNAYMNKKYKLASTYWEKLLPYYDSESKDGKLLLQAIARAQKSAHA